MRMAVIAVIALAAAAAGFATAQATRPGFRMMKLPLDLPAVGNIDDVRQWRFGRIELIERRGTDDIRIRMRLASEQVVHVVGPREPLAALGRKCGLIFVIK